ncbi:MAG: polysaccharide biosynthesis/export family protein [Leeuwenhoekiella sp.]
MILKAPIRIAFLIAVLGITVSSCVSRKKMAYFNNLEKVYEDGVVDKQQYNLVIKPYDRLAVTVSGPEAETVAPYNLQVMGSGTSGDMLGVVGTPRLQTYLVNQNGTIDFPELGNIAVAGLTRQELGNYLTEQIAEFVRSPIVVVRVVNFQISVIGEVNRPGTFNVEDEYLSISQALGLAGDLTIYGKRKDILILREENGSITYNYLDLTDADIINSPYYYLQQNDVIVVEPNASRRQGSKFNPNLGAYLSFGSLMITLAVLIFDLR